MNTSIRVRPSKKQEAIYFLRKVLGAVSVLTSTTQLSIDLVCTRALFVENGKHLFQLSVNTTPCSVPKDISEMSWTDVGYMLTAAEEAGYTF